MPELKSLLEIARDATPTPQLTDWRDFENRVVQVFHDQPNVLRRIATLILPTSFDGKTVKEIPTLDDMDRPGYGMEPRAQHIALVGDVVTARMPQIYQSVELTYDKWAQAFAGNARMPLVIAQLTRLIKREEDLIGFRGDTGENTLGLIDEAASDTDLGAPTAAWGIDAGSNGVLANAHTDIDKGLDAFVANGLGDLPVDIVLTGYLFTLLKNTMLPNRQGTNLLSIQAKLNGGQVFQTNNLQASVTTTQNSMLMIARGSGEEAGWALISSGLQIEEYNAPPWKKGVAIREKFRVKVIDSDYIRWMDGISNATS